MSNQPKPRFSRRRFLLFTIILSPIWLIVLAYAALYIRFNHAHPTLSLNLVKEHNDSFASVPEQERAWTHYLHATAISTKAPDELWLRSGAVPNWPHRPTDPTWPAASAWAAENADAIRTLHLAASKPLLACPLSDAQTRTSTAPWRNATASRSSKPHSGSRTNRDRLQTPSPFPSFCHR